MEYDLRSVEILMTQRNIRAETEGVESAECDERDTSVLSWEMTYFTDKAFPSSFLHRSRGLEEMIVRREEDDPPPVTCDLKHKHQDDTLKRTPASSREE